VVTMTFEIFAKYLEGKDFEKLVHEAKTDSNQRILGQGGAEIALFMFEVNSFDYLHPCKTFRSWSI